MPKAERSRELTREEACAVLQVAPSADETLITQAYWHLARKYRARAAQDPEARRRLDELHEAYRVLFPGREGPPDEAPTGEDESPVAEELLAWLRRLVSQTAARWQGRVPEVAVLTAAVVILTLLALAAGASALWTLLTAAVALLTIVAPWRRA